MKKNILQAENLGVSFDGFKALDISSFILEEGELRCVIGPNGAGKTTFMDVICGKTKPDHGRLLFKNEVDVISLKENEIVELGIGRKFQAPSVFPTLTVFENMMLAIKTKKSVFHSLFKRLQSDLKDKIHEVAKRVRLNEHLDKMAGSLSHGQKQWLEISMVILQDSKLLLIDEPAAGMSDDETFRTGELLLELAGEHSIIVIEHDMEFVRQIAKTVTVLTEGKVLTEGPMDEVQNDPRVIECYLGHA